MTSPRYGEGEALDRPRPQKSADPHQPAHHIPLWRPEQRAGRDV